MWELKREQKKVICREQVGADEERKQRERT
jgi:hypothetical protein